MSMSYQFGDVDAHGAMIRAQAASLESEHQSMWPAHPIDVRATTFSGLGTAYPAASEQVAEYSFILMLSPLGDPPR
jgi:hypothetical protein